MERWSERSMERVGWREIARERWIEKVGWREVDGEVD
jgi:hypothetical protein